MYIIEYRVVLFIFRKTIKENKGSSKRDGYVVDNGAWCVDKNEVKVGECFDSKAR